MRELHFKNRWYPRTLLTLFVIQILSFGYALSKNQGNLFLVFYVVVLGFMTLSIVKRDPSFVGLSVYFGFFVSAYFASTLIRLYSMFNRGAYGPMFAGVMDAVVWGVLIYLIWVKDKYVEVISKEI